MSTSSYQCESKKEIIICNRDSNRRDSNRRDSNCRDSNRRDDNNGSVGSSSTKESNDTNRLRQQNARLASEMEELRLELTYYRGEVKRLDWDNQCLTKEVDKLSSIFNGWLNNNSTGNVFDNPYHLSTIIKLPPKHILDILKCKQNQNIMLASCQPPFHVEYVNKCWSEVCGWDISDILGLSCSFLQGDDTDKEIVNAFTKDITQTAYARMRIHNYDRKGCKFATTVTVFPIYDSIAHSGPDSDIPVLTHLCAVHSDIVFFSDSEDKGSAPVLSTSKEIVQLAESKKIPMKSAERLSKASRFSARCTMDASSFLDFAANIRLSDLLRFMLTCESPLLLLDVDGMIVHLNIPWATTFGYALHDVEGLHKSILYGALTSDDDKSGCDKVGKKRMKNRSKVGCYYAKNGEAISFNTGTVPIIGGYLNPSVTHFCTMFVQIQIQTETPHQNIVSDDNDRNVPMDI